MPSINRVQLIGNVTADTPLKMTKSGKKVANFTIATNEQWKTEKGEVVKNATFHKMVVWNGLADFASKVCTKGRLMYVEGRLINRDYEGKEGIKRYVTEVVATGLKPLDYLRNASGLDAKAEVELDDLPVENIEVEEVEEEELVAA